MVEHPSRRRRAKAWLALLVAASLTFSASGCVSPGEVRFATGRHADESPDGLHAIKTWGGDAVRVYVRPGVDLKPYDRVLLDPVVIRFALNSPRTPGPRNAESARRIFREVFENALRRSNVYTLVDEPGEGVLRVTPQLVDVVLGAAPPTGARERMYVSSLGAVTLALEVSDSRTRAVLVRVFDRQPLGGRTGRPVNVAGGAGLHEAELLFTRWANRLRNRLDAVQEIPSLPAPAEP